MISKSSEQADPDDLGEGSVSDDQLKQYEEQLKHEQWRRKFERGLSNAVGAIAIGCVSVLIHYILNHEHELADAPAIIALATIPTVLLLALMSAHLTSYKKSDDDRSGQDQFPGANDNFSNQVSSATVSSLARELVRAVASTNK